MPIPTPEQRLAYINRPISPPSLPRESSATSSRSRTPVGIVKKRSLATNGQRAELRRWWNDKSFGKRQHNDAIRWFEEKFGRVL